MKDRLSEVKRPLAGWVWTNTRHMKYETVFCPFTGWPSMAMMFKEQGKGVVTTDLLEAHFHLARALVENDAEVLDPFDADRLLEPNSARVQLMEGVCNAYGIAPEHGAWLDNVRSNLGCLDNAYKLSLAMSVVLRVIRYLMSFTHETREIMPDDDPSVSFSYFVEYVNQRIFPNGLPCEAHNKDAASLVSSVNSDAMYFYVPSADGYQNLSPERRMMELFVQYCTESELDALLKGRTQALGSSIHNEGAYRNKLAAFLENADHIPIWIIGYNDAGLLPVKELESMLHQHRKNVMILENTVLLTSEEKSVEYLLIAHP